MRIWNAVCNGVGANISMMNFIKSPKKWSGQNQTSLTGFYTYGFCGAAFISVENTHRHICVCHTDDLAAPEVTINKSLISCLFYYLVGASYLVSYCVQCQWMLQEPATVDWTVHLLTTLLLLRLQLGGKVFERVANILVDA